MIMHQLRMQLNGYSKNYLIKSMLFSAFLIVFTSINAQVFLQLEKRNNPRSTKFSIGQSLKYSTNEYPEVFNKSEIIDLLPSEDLIVFSDNYLKPSQLSQLWFDKKSTRQLGRRLMDFSAVWFLYGGVATLVDDYKMSSRDIVIGGIVAGVGFSLWKFLGFKKIQLGNKFNLRIVDLRFQVNP